MGPALDSLTNGFPHLIFYLLLITAIFIVGFLVYIKLTPHKEIQLVQDGNQAAALSLAGLIIGLSMPLAACMVFKVSLWDVLVWGTMSTLLQLFLFRMTDLIFQDLPHRIARGEIPAATVLVAFKIAGSLMLAVAIAG